jgi:hypothetical protein
MKYEQLAVNPSDAAAAVAVADAAVVMLLSLRLLSLRRLRLLFLWLLLCCFCCCSCCRCCCYCCCYCYCCCLSRTNTLQYSSVRYVHSTSCPALHGRQIRRYSQTLGSALASAAPIIALQRHRHHKCGNEKKPTGSVLPTSQSSQNVYSCSTENRVHSKESTPAQE